MHGLALLGLSGFSGGGGAAAWTPAEDGALFWVDAPAARSGGRLFTTSAKTTAAVAVADPVGAIVQEGSIGSDLLQGTTSRRYYLSTFSDGQWALGLDGIDDAVTSTTFSLATGAKTLGFRLEYHTALGASEADILLSIGGSSSTARVFLYGGSSLYPGLSFICDVAGSSATRRYSGLAPSVGVPFTVVIAYNGGSITSTASYRLFVDGVEVTIDATGTSTAGAVTTALLCSSVAVSPTSGKISKAFVVSGDQSAKIARIQSYLVAP